MTMQHLVTIINNHHTAAAVVVSAAVLIIIAATGCALFRGVDKTKVAYDAAFVATGAYFAEKGKLDPATQDAVNKAYEAFKQGVVKVDPATIADFPAMLKREYTSKIPDAAMRDKVNALIDTYWAKINAAVTLAGLTPTEIVAILNAVNDGIAAGIKAAAPVAN